jgi:hypothetical protein
MTGKSAGRSSTGISTKKTPALTCEYIRSRLDYDPTTGILTWRNGPRCGKAAGHYNADGYVQIRLDGVLYQAHRLAWLHYHGSLPESGIDHRDLNGSNNAISNLREADQTHNLANTKIRSNNKSGFKGVHFYKTRNKWVAVIKKRGTRTHLGYYDTPECAAQAYRDAAERLYGDYARTA